MRNAELSRADRRSPACAATLRYDDALAILLTDAAPLPAETLPLDEAGGRILAEPLLARIDSPRCAVAAMDGYALRSSDLDEGIGRFIVRGRTFAGDRDPGRIAPGQARRIMTGAPMPAGADRVLPWEMVGIEDDTISVDAPLPQRRHVRPRGCDFAGGAALLAAGARLGPGALALAAAGDHGSVTVRRRPRVAIIAGGDELAAPGNAGALGRCPDSLSLAIAQLAVEHHGVIVDRRLLGDDTTAISRGARAMIAASDVLVMIGGAARGDRDFAKAGLAHLGLAIAFADVAMKPGKPVWYGRIGATHVLGLPGNPLAALTTARLFLAPLLAALGGGDPHETLRWTDVAFSAPAGAVGGRESFLCAMRAEGGVRVVPDQPASGHLALASTNVLVRRPADAPAAVTGDIVRVLPF